MYYGVANEAMGRHLKVMKGEKLACNPSSRLVVQQCYDFGLKLRPWLAIDPVMALVRLQKHRMAVAGPTCNLNLG